MNIAYHTDFLEHKPGRHHPENPGRLKEVVEYLKEKGLWKKVDKITPKKIDTSLIKEVHPPSQIEKIKRISESGGGRIDSDTAVSKGSYTAALRSCGAMEKLTEKAIEENEHGISLSRPPGHHALPEKAMGFCLFNSISVAAKNALKQIDKAVIFDWDVHHGNGTQKIFYEEKNLLYISIHQKPLFPGTGELKETGKNDGEGYNINIPLTQGKENRDYNYLMNEIVNPKITEFNPEIIYISAGFDSHKKDPLANMNLTSKAYHQLTKKLLKHQKPLVMALEGGYNYQALKKSIEQIITTINQNNTHKKESSNKKPSETTIKTAKKIKEIHQL